MVTQRQRRPDARPDEILQAALACFAERGFAATRLEEVARRAGLSKAAIYLYFRNKEDLMRAVVRSAFQPRLDALEAMARDPATSPKQLLTKIITAWPSLAQNPQVTALPKLILAEAENFPDLTRFYGEFVVDRAMGVVRDLLARGVAAGEFRPMDVDLTSFCVLGPLLMGVLWKRTFEPFVTRSLDLHALAKVHADQLVRSLCVAEAIE